MGAKGSSATGIQGVETRNVTKTTCNIQDTPHNNYPTQNVNSAEIEKL